METPIEHLLCKHCGPRVAAIREAERAYKQAQERLRALGVEPLANGTRAPAAPRQLASTATVVDPFKGRRGSRWRNVAVAPIVKNIRGDISPHDLCAKLGIATSVLHRRVRDIIGQPDAGTRWQKGIGYTVKGKPAWDHDRGTLRIDKTKGAAMQALAARKASVGKPGGKSAELAEEDLRDYVSGKVTVDKLMRKYKCGKSTVYKALKFYKIRFGADAPHGEPAPAPADGSNGVSAPVTVSA